LPTYLYPFTLGCDKPNGMAKSTTAAQTLRCTVRFGYVEGVVSNALQTKVFKIEAIAEVRMARLELARREPHAPQACVSTDSTTSAD
jgi:hypothetical protein